jgi:predicted nucleic acid-binding protein
MPLVIDASIVAAWHFPDERSAQGDSIMARLESDSARMPALWWFEVRNVLLIGERRGRTMREYSGRFLDFLRGLPIEIAPLPEELAVLSLARRHQLSFYDAAYLELAQRERIALATLDRALARAAVAEGVELIGAV